MNDRCVSLLDNYDVEVLRTTKGRGAILCETNQGMLIFKEYIERRNKIHLQNEGFRASSWTTVSAEQILKNKEEELLTMDFDGTAYVLKTYFAGRECDLKDSENCNQAVGHWHSSIERSFGRRKYTCGNTGEFCIGV